MPTYQHSTLCQLRAAEQVMIISLSDQNQYWWNIFLSYHRLVIYIKNYLDLNHSTHAYVQVFPWHWKCMCIPLNLSSMNSYDDERFMIVIQFETLKKES